MSRVLAALFTTLLLTPLADAAVDPALLQQVVEWRRDFHQHPELGHQETRTAGIVAEHLRALGLDVRTGIAGPGVAAVLRGSKPGPKIALRADMDALPVVEQTGLPFASTVKSTYRGEPVGVMHACGHDAHTAILMGVASVLAAQRDTLAGEVMFVFQPAEEGPPEVGAPFGAKLMLDEGLFADFEPQAVFGLHVWAPLQVGTVGTRSGPLLASADEWSLVVRGTQTHGSRPWAGVDPISVAAQILLGTHTIVARQVDITASPIVLTAGTIKGGVRFNIIPSDVEMVGTLRSFDMDARSDVIRRFERTAQHFAEASGATAELRVVNNAPVTRNDPALTRRMQRVLAGVVGESDTIEMPLNTIAEDFAHYAQRVPGFYWFVGATSQGVDPATAPNNHSPQFMLDEDALRIGIETMTAVAREALNGNP